MIKFTLTSFVVLCSLYVTGCTSTLKVLEGADYACGSLHVEGYVTDTQGDIKIGKVPDTWTPEDFKSVCGA